MKYFLFCFVVLSLHFQSFADKNHDRTMYFVQAGDTIVPDSNGVVKLSKSSFEIRMSLHDNDVVVTNLGINSNNLEAINNGVPKDSLECFGIGKGMSDYPNNSKKWLMVKSNDNSYWPYVSKYNRTRFDKTETKGKDILVTRTVENLIFFEEGMKDECKIEKCPVDKLYLIYFTNYDNEEGSRSRSPIKTLTLAFE